MAVYSWPSDVSIAAFDAGVEYDVQFNVMRNGSITTYGLPGARWVCAVGFSPEVESMKRPKIEALLMKLEGGANRLAMHHHGRPIPNGSMRGTPIINTNAPAGSKSIQLANVNGTLLAGDIIGVLGQNLMVVDDAAPSGGLMTVNVRGALRAAVTVGASVTWNKPTINWIPRTNIAGPFPFRPAKVRPGFTVEFIEQF